MRFGWEKRWQKTMHACIFRMEHLDFLISSLRQNSIRETRGRKWLRNESPQTELRCFYWSKSVESQNFKNWLSHRWFISQVQSQAVELVFHSSFAASFCYRCSKVWLLQLLAMLAHGLQEYIRKNTRMFIYTSFARHLPHTQPFSLQMFSNTSSELANGLVMHTNTDTHMHVSTRSSSFSAFTFAFACGPAGAYIIIIIYTYIYLWDEQQQNAEEIMKIIGIDSLLWLFV